MVIDGVYAIGDDGRPEFRQLPAPEDEEVVRMTMLVSQRVQSLLMLASGCRNAATITPFTLTVVQGAGGWRPRRRPRKVAIRGNTGTLAPPGARFLANAYLARLAYFGYPPTTWVA